jgi:2-amino-4-hydroxy-6-hydroxymethyldihydropteridine diphosphokinase
MSFGRGARVYLALGSNLGDRAGHLRDAVRALAQGGVRVVRGSPLYASDYVGPPPDQPEYLNAVIEGRTEWSPRALLQLAQQVERAAGRPPAAHGLPRPLDIDLLFYDEIQMVEPDLVLPHPRIGERRFVLEPLHDLGALAAWPDLDAARRRLAAVQRLERLEFGAEYADAGH